MGFGGAGLGIGITLGPSGGRIATPLTILGSSLLQWVRADLDVAHVAGRVSAWADQSGNGKDYTQAVGANQPLLSASGGPNNHAYVSLDSSARILTSLLNLPRPSTLASTVWFVARQNTWIANAALVASVTDNARLMLRQRTATPNVAQFEGVDANANSAGTLTSWFRWDSLFANTAAAYVRIGATKISGTAVDSAAAATGRSIGGGSIGVSALIDVCELLYVNRALTAAEVTRLDAYATARYGAGLV